MQNQDNPKNVLSLTSNQIADLIAKSFRGFINSTRKIYRDDLSSDLKFLGNKVQSRSGKSVKGNPGNKGIQCGRGNKEGRKKLKGHVPIRSQTGHDHDRHHQKY